MRAALLTLTCAASLLAEGPPPEKYLPTKLLEIHHPSKTVYTYLFLVGYVAISPVQLKIKEGDTIQFATEGYFLYLIDDDGKVQKTRWSEAHPPGFPSRPIEKR